jgi:uncharacterized protein YutE (UPF0331/DUF86 family)
MLDRERILSKVSELDGYLAELASLAPRDFEAYQRTETKRACERLLQIAVEAVIAICHLFVTGLRLGLPAEENDIFEKLERKGIISGTQKETLRQMKGFRNILVHEYGEIDDRIVYEAVKNRPVDFEAFKREMLKALKESGSR